MSKIAFFIGSLVSGGKERRFVELLTYLKKVNEFEILVITTSHEMDFPQFKNLGIKVHQIRKNKRVLGTNIPVQFLRIIQKFDADIVHSWGRIQTFYALPAKVLLGFKLVNGQITNATKSKKLIEKFIDSLNFSFSDRIVSNSEAGLLVYSPPKSKSLVIKNGMNFSRFENLPSPDSIKKKYHISTPYTVVMVATFSENKDYMRYLALAKEVLKIREDVTFLAVGTYHKNRRTLFDQFQSSIGENPNIKTTGLIHDVEALVNACDIGVLFTNTEVHGEGISNSVIEYMALGKPVLANDAGGTREIIIQGKNGYLATKERPYELAKVVDNWLNDKGLMDDLGKHGKHLIYSEFSIGYMGKSFTELYKTLANKVS